MLAIGQPEIMWRENWISPENKRMRMLPDGLFPFVLLITTFTCSLLPVCPLPASRRGPIRLPTSSRRPPARGRLLLFFPRLAHWILIFSPARPAEEEDHHHLRGGEEVPAQVHYRSKGQHPAGDPGDHGGVRGDASSGLWLRDHHPQRGAGQAGTGAHTGVRKGKERGGGECTRPSSPFTVVSIWRCQ